jgi:capsular polysaccharide biosynthesis protein
VIVPILVAGLGAFFLSSRQEPEYRASAVVFVDTTDLTSDSQRLMNTLAGLSHSPELARQVAAELPGMTPGAVLDQTAVAASADADLLSVTATDSREAMAVRLANTFASQVTKFTEEFVRRKQRRTGALRLMGRVAGGLLARVPVFALRLLVVFARGLGLLAC